MKKRKYIYFIVIFIIILFSGYFLFFNKGIGDIRYRTENVSRGDILLQVRATGTINPVRTVQVGSQVSGIIERLYVDFNSEVKRGQILAQIDSTFLYASVKEAEASFERTQAQVNEAERNYNRTVELFKKDLVSQAELDAAKTAYESAVAQQKQAQGSLDRARVNLRYAIITSPIDGVVISRDIDVGQTVASSFQTPKLFSIAMDLRHMQVEASVDEADIGQVKVGQEVTFTVDSYPDEQFRGRVSQVRLSPVIVENVVTYTVIIDVDNPDLKLRPGMTATVSILIDKRQGVLRISALAIRFQPPQEILEAMQKENSNKPNDVNSKDKEVASDKPDTDTSKARFAEMGQRDRFMSGGDRPNQGGTRWPQNSHQNRPAGNRDSFSEGEPGAPKTAHVWILREGNKLQTVNIKIGLSDSRYIELISDSFKENDEVIVGLLGNGFATNSPQSSPFGPQRMMMGRGR